MCPSWRRKLFCSYTHIYSLFLSLSLCRYIYFYIYFVFFLLSTLFFILSLPDFGTHSFYHIHSHILTHTHSSSLSGNTLNYIYIYCIYISRYMVSRFAQIVNAFSRRTGEQSFFRCRQYDRHDTRNGTFHVFSVF